MSITADLRLALDPVAFAQAAGIEPDDWQRNVLRSTASRLLLNVSRQAGKSTVASILAVHEALYHPRSLVLALSPSLRQSQLLFRKCVSVYRAVGRPVHAETESALRLALDNGSEIVALPANEESIRGFSAVSLLLVDEAARVQDDLYRAVRPMLATSGGRLLAMSTPWGKRGWWHDAWTAGGPAWQRVEVPASQCPRITAAFLAEEEKALGARWYRQEYGCQFSENSEQIFAYDDLMRAVTPEVTPLFGGSHE